MEDRLLRFLAGRRKTDMGAVQLHYLSAHQLLQASAEARELCGEDTQTYALCLNACVLARAAKKDGKTMFPDGAAVLRALPPQTIAKWITQYQAACELDNPPCTEQAAEGLEKSLAANARERMQWRVLRAFGVLPSERRAKSMTDGDYLYCVMQMKLDAQEQMEGLCPSCREKIRQPHCTLCGQGMPEVNAAFDETRFEELKRGELSRTDFADAEPAGGSI